MQKIIPCIWFDHQAMEAANFYVSIFKNSKIESVSHYQEGSPMPAGSVLALRFSLGGQVFTAMNGGPMYSVTPAISFFANCESEQELEGLWSRLSDGGTAFMELGTYPFSPKFGWVQDRFGVSWQLDLGRRPQKITPFLMFSGIQSGHAEEAMNLYCSLLNGKIDSMSHHGFGVQKAMFHLHGQEFMASDGGPDHDFGFTEGLSLYVNCKDQEEIDFLWDNLTMGGVESQCGWLKDKFGVSWQIINESFEEMISDGNPERAKRVMEALFTMKKIKVKELEEA